MNQITTNNQILDVVMSLDIDQRVEVLNYVSLVQKKADKQHDYKEVAMLEIQQALRADTQF